LQYARIELIKWVEDNGDFQEAKNVQKFLETLCE